MTNIYKLISVIVPVYNAEKYLDRCIESVVNQTYVNFELILVDDGSTDRSGTICDEWVGKDNRIVVYHNKNRGPSYSRNYGLKFMNGEYVCFIDADDYVEADYLEKLHFPFTSNDIQMSICGVGLDFPKRSEFWKYQDTSAIDNIKNCIFDLKSLIVSPWCKLYLSKIIKQNNIEFPNDMRHAEDGFFNCLYIEKIAKFAYISSVFYHYNRLESDTLSAKPTLKTYCDSLRYIEQCSNTFAKILAKNKEEIISRDAISCGYNTFFVEDGDNSFFAAKERFLQFRKFVTDVHWPKGIKQKVLTACFVYNLPIVIYFWKKIKYVIA